MKAIGIHLAKDQFCYAVLDGTKFDPSLIDKARLVTPTANDVPALMDWYETQFDLILDKYKPECVAYRLTLNPNKNQLLYSSFPLGVLNLVAFRRRLAVEVFVAQQYVASRLGLPKGTDLYAYCDEKFGLFSAPSAKNQKHSVLAAWFVLP